MVDHFCRLSKLTGSDSNSFDIVSGPLLLTLVSLGGQGPTEYWGDWPGRSEVRKGGGPCRANAGQLTPESSARR